MRTIITGGTGLIGRALSTELVRAGYEVVVLSRDPKGKKMAQEGVTVVSWDGQTCQGWAQFADGADAIVNLAGESLAGKNLFSMRWTPERKRQLVESRVQASSAVVDAIHTVDHKPKLMVQASAVGFYGPRGSERITEDVEAGKDFMAEICINWEASSAAVESLGVRRVVMRLGVVLSWTGGALPRQMLPFRLFVGGPIGSGKQGYPWIHPVDVSRAIRFFIETPTATGIYNLCAPQTLTNAEFGRALAHALRRPFWLPLPALPFKIAFGEASEVLLEGQMAYPKRLLEMGFEFRYPEIGVALANL